MFTNIDINFSHFYKFVFLILKLLFPFIFSKNHSEYILKLCKYTDAHHYFTP